MGSLPVQQNTTQEAFRLIRSFWRGIFARLSQEDGLAKGFGVNMNYFSDG
jgi:hypothetical protein